MRTKGHKCYPYLWFQSGETPLTFAAMNGHRNVVDILLQYGATVDKIDRVSVVDNIFITLLMNVCMHL